MLLLALAFALATDAPAPDVTVREERGVYSVSARFVVSQPPRVVLDVLTDYEGIPRFMPGVRKSTVIERVPGITVVEQEALSRLMMFSKTVHLVLEITEGTDSVSFRDRSGRSFTRYEGSWQLSEVAGGTAIHYLLTAQPSFDVPEFVLKRLLKRDSGQMIESLRREMAASAKRGSTT
jgi:ribosome-associated toxin RatA of RatAB toxin-antitoxin module